MATIPEALAIAAGHHQAGRLQEAEQTCRIVLQANPNQADALHLLGIIALQVGQPEVAVEYIERAIESNADIAAFHGSLGEALRALHRMSEVIACYKRAVKLKPDSAGAHNNLGLALFAQGRPDEAVACFRRAVELQPDNAGAHGNLGNVLKNLGKLDEAVASYQRALVLKPDFAWAHNNLGNALRDQRKLDEAVACYQRALELKPDFVGAHGNLGNVLKNQGRLADAVACYRRAVELKPDNAEVHNNLGLALHDQGKLAEAIACYRRALGLEPASAELHSNLGAALKDQGKLGEAIACFRRALELKPNFAGAYGNLGNALKEQGMLAEAVACFRRTLELNPSSAEAYNNLGLTFLDQGKMDEAVRCFRRALELQPDDAEAHGHLGDALEELGDLRGAENCFRVALRHNPRFAFAHHKLAGLLGGKLPETDLAEQRRLLEEGALTDAQRLLLHFGLAQVLDARGEYAEAAEHADRGNSLQRSECSKRGQEYAPKEYESLVTRTIEICTPDFFSRLRGFGSDSEIPVFVVGLPRSGTTLVEQILAGHSQVYAAGETKLVLETLAAIGGREANSLEGLRRLDRETAGRLAERHLERLCAIDRPALRIVDKQPDNYLYLGMLASLFPRAKLIHCRRDLRDVAVSCWMTPFQNVCWATDRRHIASRFHEYQRIMEHWWQVLPVPVLEVDYEKTVADLEGVARKLVAWCGLAWESACLDFPQTKRPVRTASAVQVRQPVYGTSVGRWKHYEHALGPLFAELERRAGS